MALGLTVSAHVDTGSILNYIHRLRLEIPVGLPSILQMCSQCTASSDAEPAVEDSGLAKVRYVVRVRAADALAHLSLG
jgi:hypothetical protein